MNSQVKGIIWIALFAATVVTLIQWEDWGLGWVIGFGIGFIAWSIYWGQGRRKA
jgi:hypothetical protein